MKPRDRMRSIKRELMAKEWQWQERERDLLEKLDDARTEADCATAVAHELIDAIESGSTLSKSDMKELKFIVGYKEKSERRNVSD